ncbi:MAG: glycosyl transferase, partial [Clostridiales bacterium]|nr:glycosyl transferase [Clostridiales bacterium]
MEELRVLFINHTCGIGSTGRICAEIAENFIANGDEAVVAYGRGEVPERYKSISHRFGNNLNLYWHAAYTRLTDNHGFASKYATKEFLRWANEY